MRCAFWALILGTLVACGGDGRKTTTACTDDPDCGGGVCFEQACHGACAQTNQCDDDELCVRKDKGGVAADLCVVAAEHAGCTGPADCDDLLTGPCEQAACDVESGLCAVDALPDGAPCGSAQGVCEAGACAEPTAPVECPDVSGPWTVREHCSQDMIGLVSTITQDGCSISSDWGGPAPFTGAVSSDGALTMSGSTGETVQTCTGSLADDTITLDCTPDACHVVTTKGEPASTCAVLADTFQPCGGDDLAGIWDFTRICVPYSALENEITAACAASTVTGTVVWHGTLVLAAEGTCAFDLTQEINGLYTVPLSCLDGQACVGLMDANKFATTCEESGTDCICTLHHEQDDLGDDPPTRWTVEGTNLVFADDGGAPGTAMPFCAARDGLTIKAPWNDGAFDLYMQLKRR